MGTVGVSAVATSGADSDRAKPGEAGASVVDAGGRRGELGAVGEFATIFDLTGGPQNQSGESASLLISTAEQLTIKHSTPPFLSRILLSRRRRRQRRSRSSRLLLLGR